eukprot:SAG11_NODE_1863_length_4154_cov_3.719359_5_plen_107_part_00
MLFFCARDLVGLAHLPELRLKLRIDPLGSLPAAHCCGIYAVSSAAILALSVVLWRCFDEILVRTVVPFTVLEQSVKSSAVAVRRVLHPPNALDTLKAVLSQYADRV